MVNIPKTTTQPAGKTPNKYSHPEDPRKVAKANPVCVWNTKTRGGIGIGINDTAYNEYYYMLHKGGTGFAIYPDGAMKTTLQNGSYVQGFGEMRTSTSGVIDTNCAGGSLNCKNQPMAMTMRGAGEQGGLQLSASGPVNATCGGGMNILAKSFEVAGGKMALKSSSDLAVTTSGSCQIGGEGTMELVSSGGGLSAKAPKSVSVASAEGPAVMQGKTAELSSVGGGVVLVKDNGEIHLNPTGTNPANIAQLPTSNPKPA